MFLCNAAAASAGPGPRITTDPIYVEADVEPAPGEAASAERTIDETDRTAPTVDSWFEGMPGVQVQHAGAPAQRSNLSIRGADGQQTLVLFDGVPIGGLQGGGTDLSLLPTLGIDRIRVLRGGLSDQAGSDALGGLVLIEPGPIASQRRSILSLRGGSFGTRGLDALLSGRPGDVGVRGVFSYFSTDGDFVFLDDQNRSRQQQNSDAQLFRGLLQADLQTKGSGRWRLSHLSSYVERGIPGPSEFPSTQARQDGLHLLTVLHHDGLVGQSGLIRSFVAHRMERSLFQDPEPPFSSPIEQPALMHAGFAGVDGRWFPNAQHEVTLNLRGQLDRGRITDPSGAADTIFQGRGSVALSDHWRRGNLSLYGGLRAEMWKLATPVLAPRLGLGWRPNPRGALRVRAGIGRAYRIPSIAERLLNWGALRGNPDLQPEVGWSGDLSLEWIWPKMELQLTPFASRYERTIIFLPASLYVIQAQNARDITVLGVENQLAIGPFAGHRFSASYTYTRGRFDASGVALPGRPDHSGQVAWSYARGMLFLQLMARARDGITLDRYGSLREEGHVFVSGAVGLEFSVFRLTVRAENILDDQTAVDHLQLALPGRAVYAVLTASEGRP